MACNHEYTEVIRMPEGPHWGKLICSDCGAFIKWLKKPGAKSYKDRCAELVRLCDCLLDNTFVRSVTAQYEEKEFLSNSQYAWLKKIAEDNNLSGKIKELQL